MADETHGRKIVRDEQIGGVALGLDALQQIDDFGSSRWVQRRGRFVEHDQFGVASPSRARCRRAAAGPRKVPLDSASSIAGSSRTSRIASAFSAGACRGRVSSASATSGSAITGRSSSGDRGTRPAPGRRTGSGLSDPGEILCPEIPSRIEIDRTGARFEEADDQRPTVVLPEPLSPTSPSVSPGWMEKLTSFSRLHDLFEPAIGNCLKRISTVRMAFSSVAHREMATRKMAGPNFGKRWARRCRPAGRWAAISVAAAPISDLTAARPFRQPAMHPQCRTMRECRKQHQRIGMGRHRNLASRGGFHDLPCKHHGDAVAEVSGNADITGDEQQCAAVSAQIRPSASRIWACTVTSRPLVASSG